MSYLLPSPLLPAVPRVAGCLELSSLSCEPVRVPVLVLAGGVVTDPTGWPVQLAFVTAGVDPQPGDWLPGFWEREARPLDEPPNPGVGFYACALIGPDRGLLVLDPGRYDVWVGWDEGVAAPRIRTPGGLVVT